MPTNYGIVISSTQLTRIIKDWDWIILHTKQLAQRSSSKLNYIFYIELTLSSLFKAKLFKII